MKKKKLIIVLLVLLLLVVAGVVTFFVIKGNDKKEDKKEEKETVEKITITFDADGGEKVEDIEFTKGTPVNLPITTKEGYNFVGWYNGSDKYDDDNTYTIEKNIVLTAKWEKIESEKEKDVYLTITFDSDGGNKINNKSVKCVNGSVTITNLPKPTKDFYVFMSWEDKNGKSILDGAKLTCKENTTLKLKAVWEYDGPVANPDQNDNPGTPTPQKSYKCPDGYQLKDTNRCVKLTDPEKYCDDGWKEINGECVKKDSYNKGERKCPSKTFNGYTGEGVYYEAGRGYCAYVELPSYTGNKTGCEGAKGTYLSVNYRCFRVTGQEYVIECKSNEKHFEGQAIAPGSNPGCYTVAAMKKRCPSGYVSTSVYGECAMIKDATYE